MYRSRKTILHQTIKSTTTRPRSGQRLPDRSRKILHDPTFIFTGTTTTKLTVSSKTNTDKKTDKATKICKFTCSKLKDPTSSTETVCAAGVTNSAPCRVQGCGEQFRKQGNIKMTDTLSDDTTPGELAAYFDQLLHIPKPMSQMAEMMYT